MTKFMTIFFVVFGCFYHFIIIVIIFSHTGLVSLCSGLFLFSFSLFCAGLVFHYSWLTGPIH